MIHYETNAFDQVVKNHNLVSYPEPFGMPDKYAGWVKGRGAHMAPVLLTRTADRMKNITDNVFQHSIKTASDFHEALGIKYKVIDVKNIDASPLKHPIEGFSLFLYRNSREVEELTARLAGSKIIGNHPILNLGKDILHTASERIDSPEDLFSGNAFNGIPVPAGATCFSRGEAQRITALFRSVQRDCIYKDANGTDGNGITPYLDEVRHLPVVVEEKLSIDHTLSVQYMNGILGIMKERDKPADDHRWRGNTLPYQNQNLEHTRQFSNQVCRYAEVFAKTLERRFGQKPVIFGLDFAVCWGRDGSKTLKLLDPNVRMPGNMYLYYQIETLRQHGLDPGFAETAVLYGNEVPHLKGEELQLWLNSMGIGLIHYDSTTKQPFGIRLDEEGRPDGILVIVQDPEDRINNLSMISVFGNTPARTATLIKTFIALRKSNHCRRRQRRLNPQ